MVAGRIPQVDAEQQSAPRSIRLDLRRCRAVAGSVSRLVDRRQHAGRRCSALVAN